MQVVAGARCDLNRTVVLYRPPTMWLGRQNTPLLPSKIGPVNER